VIQPARDHLFISYAWENGQFAEWLALKLTAEGYRVWCDRFKLLGGESYPQDIDRAIREHTFRLLALMSRDSVNKPNPLKERTLALNLARERKEDFLIPLNVDGLAPTELGWMLSDLSYISFHRGWADGLTQLIKKLRSLDAPRPLADGGRGAVTDWFAQRETVSKQPERLWSNLIPIEEVPPELVRITVASTPSAELLANWSHYRQNDSVYWAFEAPADHASLDLVDVEAVPWEGSQGHPGLRLPDIVQQLVRAHLRGRALSKGMVLTPDGKHLYFPAGLLPGNRLSYVGYDGKRTFVLAVGERTFRVGALGHEREKTRYHLSPTFRPSLWKYEQPIVDVQMRLFLTDLTGKPLESRKAARRRKAIGKNWWNYEWVSRTLATGSWLSDGADQVNLASAPGVKLTLAGRPLTRFAPVGIDESGFVPVHDDEDAELIEEESHDGDDNAIEPEA
jgi:hypothetical protein